IRVSAPRKRSRPPAAPGGGAGPAPANPQTPATPADNGFSGVPMTPLNASAPSATRLGLPVGEIPATVEVVERRTIAEQGYRTTTETAQGAVGVLSGDAAAAPAGFSMRGFTFSEVNILYNGISIGPQSITSRWMDTANLSQVEFLKGPSSL